MKEYTVFKTWDEPIADMAVDILRRAGIHAAKTGDVPRSVLPFTIDGLGEIEIRVPVDEYDRATEILAARFSAAMPETDTESPDDVTQPPD